MTKKTYENPTMQVFALRNRDIILTSTDPYGMLTTLDANEVEDAW